MDDEELDDLLNDYLPGRGFANPDMEDVEFEWVRGNPNYGTDHIARHGVTEQEVEEAILQTPPDVDAKQHPQYPNRTIFWGCTARGRWLFIVCEDRREGDRRLLTPITAYMPADGVAYWNRQ